jgi:hypothetical protein
MVDLQVTNNQMKATRVICIAVAASGVIISIAAVIFNQGNAATMNSPKDLDTLRFVHLLLAGVTIFSSRLIGEKVLAGKMQPQQSFFQRYQSSAIIQLAAIEGLTLFGAVIVMAAPTELVAGDPTYYLHLTPVVLLILRAQQLYPTQDKLEMASRAYQG